MNTKIKNIVERQYNDSIKKFENDIIETIENLKQDDLDENKKEKYTKELEILFSRKKKNWATYLGSATHFWIFFMGENVKDANTLSIKEVLEIPVYKSYICKTKLKENEDIFDKLDEKINESLISIKSKYKLKDLSKIKNNKAYFWNIVK